MRDKYNVTIRIESVDGYSITVELDECPRDALILLPQIAAPLQMLEDTMPEEG